jgi:hypothetical protein
MKKAKILYWSTTILIFLMDGLIPALTFNSDLAKQGISHLGFPDYFRIQLTIYKVIGCLLLILPFIPRRIKEWAYVGFGFNFISATFAHIATDGISAMILYPVIAFGILAVSYYYFHKLHDSSTEVQLINKRLNNLANA